MRIAAAGMLCAGLLLAAAHAAGGEADAPAAAPPAAGAGPGDWTGWAAPLAADEPSSPAPSSPAAEIDVVDAHWMALTMWGEARGGGGEAMRAVGHVIDNRRRAGMHGRYATDQIGEAFQFSCWNPGDPNREKMLNVDALPAESVEGRMWAEAKRIAAEILAGRSADPTGGALFYHTIAVAPRWSRGVPPVRRIGDHLFFLRAV